MSKTLLNCGLSLFVLLTISFAACHSEEKHLPNHENPDITGGPCTYQTDSIPLKLIDTIQFPNGNIDLVFSLSHSHFNDTLNYAEIMQSYLTQQGTYDLSFDSTYLLIHQTIQSGSCNPQFDNIILK